MKDTIDSNSDQQAVEVVADGLEPNALGLVSLEALCPLLGMTYVVARRKHAAGTLAVKAFRLGDTRRGPLFVHMDDIEKLITRRRSRAAPAYLPRSGGGQ